MVRSAEIQQHVSGQANVPLSKPAHSLKHEEVVTEIGTDDLDGLTSAEAGCRLSKYGRNVLDHGHGVYPAKILIRQVANAMMLVKRPTAILP
jgi:hypothetical protein